MSRKDRFADTATVAEAHRLYGMGVSAIQIAARLGFSSRAVHRWVKKPPPIIPASRPPASGLCNADPELFFNGHYHEAAKAVCACCPVLAECREYGIEHPDQSGIWGGMSQNQRRKAARDRRV